MFYEQNQSLNARSVILNQTYFNTPLLPSSRTMVEKTALLKGKYLLCEGFQITFGFEIAYKQFIECNQPDLISHTQFCQYTKRLYFSKGHSVFHVFVCWFICLLRRFIFPLFSNKR